MSINAPERRPLPHRIARRFDHIQDVYEARKNHTRRDILTKLLPADGVGAELGVHKGHLTPLLLEWTRPKKLYVVDPWYLLGPTWDWAAGDKSTVNGLRRVLKRIEPALGDGRAEVVIADDREWLANVEDGTLDWVYLDSSHEYHHTLEELELLVRKVRLGGVIAGDDWNADPNHRHHGVCKAVTEYADAGRLELTYTDDRTKQWAVGV
jgi:hypothetical protein